jgi:toxin ParE1/3/4
MSATIIRHDQAITDMQAIVDHIGKDRPRTAERFLLAAEKAIQLLAKMPQLGGRCEINSPQLQGMRVWSIRKFKTFLIFYRPIENGIEVVRVLHGIRDLESLFE